MKLKYMGSYDERVLKQGDDLGGRISDPLPVELLWSTGNRWVIDTEADAYSDVPGEVWDLLVEEFPDEFRDVSDYKRVPLNLHQTRYLGMAQGDQKTETELSVEAEARREEIRKIVAEDVAVANAAEDLEEADRKELLDRAKDLEVAGYSSMNKDQLRDAIEAAVQSRAMEEANVAEAVGEPGSASVADAGDSTTVGGSTRRRGGRTTP